jgi:valyl-tRNA synthetase
MNRGEDVASAEGGVLAADDGRHLSFADRWIRSRLASVIQQAREAIEAYRFNDYANLLYQFTWHEFCDWYIEMSKLSLNGTVGSDAEKSRRLLVEILEQILLLLHPITPFVTEEIWQHLQADEGGRGEHPMTIMIQRYPGSVSEWVDMETEQKMDFLIAVIRAVRNLRMEINCPPGKDVRVIFQGPVQDLSFVRAQEPYLRALARVGSAEYLTSGEPPKGAVTAVVGSTEIYLPLGDIDVAEERARLTRETGKVEEELARIQKKLSNPEFLAKAKAEVIQREREKSTQQQEKLRALARSLERLGEIE